MHENPGLQHLFHALLDFEEEDEEQDMVMMMIEKQDDEEKGESSVSSFLQTNGTLLQIFLFSRLFKCLTYFSTHSGRRFLLQC